MRVLFDIVHPANVLFFYNPIRILRERGHEAIIVSRRKDITIDLLDRFGFAHRPISTAARGLAGLAREMLERDLRLWGEVRRSRPDVLTGFGGVAVSHVGWLTRVPSIVFYDTEIATLQNRIAFPFLTELHVPDCYAGPTPAGRTHHFAGVKELSYLHPRHFRPDREVAIACGLDPERDNFFIRIVDWRANHDIGLKGWSPADLERIVAVLAERGRVHLSSERPLPDHVAAFKYTGRIDQVHHLLGHCRLYVGESATMASEASILGIPAIYAGRDFRGYAELLEKAGILINLLGADAAQTLAAIDRQMAHPAAHYRACRDELVAKSIDVATYVADTLSAPRH